MLIDLKKVVDKKQREKKKDIEKQMFEVRMRQLYYLFTFIL